MGTPQHPPQVWPTVRARDTRAMIDFLVAAFGFVELVAYEDDGMIGHAELGWPLGGGIMLGAVRQLAAGESDPWPQEAGHEAAYVVTEDPDGLFARALAAGATVVRPLTDTDYGAREFSVRDPEGNLWSFGTYRGHAWS
jgi:uncharacterized glyoxalase superfamily protein PhnB